jgi:hypothetical protein
LIICSHSLYTEAVMRRLIAVCLLFATSVFANPITLAYESPWVSLGPNEWRTTFMRNSDGRAETVTLTRNEKVLTFVSRSTCQTRGKFEVLTWKYGDYYATGTGCAGEEVRSNTLAWRKRMKWLPYGVLPYYRD